MATRIKNQEVLAQHGNKLLDFCQERFGFERAPNITFLTDRDEYHKLFGKTAYYDPQNENIVVYIHGRHPKDILRSLAHEIIHHHQNCRGELFSQETLGPGYAQKDSHMREMEREAYEKGNLAFRDYEDILKQKRKGESIMIERKLKSAIKNLIKQKLKEGKMPKAALAALDKKRGQSNLGEEDSNTEDCSNCQGKGCAKCSEVVEEGKCAECGKANCACSQASESNELEESKIITPEQEESFHNRLFGTRLVALNAKLMSNFIKK